MMHVKAIGIVGTIGSGKDAVKAAISQNFSCYQVNLSGAIFGQMEKKKGTFNRGTMQDMGNELRGKYGGFVLAKVSTEFMSRDKPYLIVDGIKNPAEAEWLKKTYKDFILVGVDAPREARFERIKARNEPTDPKTLEEFTKADERDQGTNEPHYGQQVRKCLEMADIVVQNDGNEEQFKAKMQELFSRINTM